MGTGAGAPPTPRWKKEESLDTAFTAFASFGTCALAAFHFFSRGT
jgi:hypothetical protein